MLILIILICIALLLAFIFWVRRYSFLHAKTFNIYILAVALSLILSLQIGRYLWVTLAKTAQQYTDFITGFVGFNNSSKTVEYYTLLSTIVVFIIFYVVILKIYEINKEDKEYERGIIKLSLYALVPAAIMAGQSLRVENTDTLLKTSSAFVGLLLVVICFLRFLLTQAIIKPEDVFRIGSKLILGITFMGVSELGAALFLPKFGILLIKAIDLVSTNLEKFNVSIPIPTFGIVTYQFGIISALILIILVFLVLKFRKRFKSFEDKLDLGVILSQLGIPLLFSALISAPVVLNNGAVTLFHYKPILFIILFGLAVFSYMALFLHFKNKTDNAVGRLISPWILVAILVYVQGYNASWPNIALDEYHAGEFYLPWWLFKQFGYLPFADYMPARGLINYFPGLLSWLFYDDTFSGQSIIGNVFSALYVFFAFFSLREIVGDFVAFLSVASLFIYMGEPSGNLVVVIACLAILLKASYDKNFIKALWLWVGFSIFIPLFSIAEGSVFILGTLPLGLWLLIQTCRNSRRNLLISSGIFFLLACVLALTTDLSRTFIAAIRYLLEEAGVNDVANGIIWQLPIGSENRVTAGYLWQFIRFSWLFLLVPILIRLINFNNKEESTQDQLFLVALFIMCIVLIPRAAGRIDADDAYSRLGMTSSALILCALPLVILPPIKNTLHKAGAILIIALLFGLIGTQESYTRSAMSLYKQVIYEPANLINGQDFGLSNIGKKVVMNENQLRRQINIKKVLHKILAPQETYFDATSHNADYGFQGRPSPVSVTAVYNASSTPLQIRMINQLEEKQIPLVLIYGENIVHDGGTLPLRNYAIYDYLLKEYSPFKDKYERIWMIRNGEKARLTNANYKIGSQKESLEILSSVFWQKDILELPVSWGNSTQSLNSKMKNPQDILMNGKVESIHDFQQLENGDWRATGSDPFIVFAIPRGVKGDLLLIETDRKVSGNNMQVFWENDLVLNFNDADSFLFRANSSKYIIPVSAAPSWYLSNNVQKIRINLPSNFEGIVHFNKIILYDRVVK